MFRAIVSRAASLVQAPSRAFHTSRVLLSRIPTLTDEGAVADAVISKDTVDRVAGPRDVHRRKAYIFKPSRNTMQNEKNDQWFWRIQLEPVDRWTGTLMGWPSTEDPSYQTLGMMTFDTEEEAIRFAESQDLDYEVIEPKQRAYIPKSYAANFKWKGPPKDQK